MSLIVAMLLIQAVLGAPCSNNCPQPCQREQSCVRRPVRCHPAYPEVFVTPRPTRCQEILIQTPCSAPCAANQPGCPEVICAEQRQCVKPCQNSCQLQCVQPSQPCESCLSPCQERSSCFLSQAPTICQEEYSCRQECSGPCEEPCQRRSTCRSGQCPSPCQEESPCGCSSRQQGCSSGCSTCQEETCPSRCECEEPCEETSRCRSPCSSPCQEECSPCQECESSPQCQGRSDCASSQCPTSSCSSPCQFPVVCPRCRAPCGGLCRCPCCGLHLN